MKISKEELKELYVTQNLPISVICEKLNYTKKTVYAYAQKYNLKRPKKCKMHDNIKYMIELYKKGYSTYEISNKLEISASTVQKYLKRAGINLSIKKDILNAKFGKLTVIKEIDSDNCLCKCQCGNFIERKRKRLLDGRNTSCGCSMGKFGKDNPSWSGYKDITGTAWGSLKSGAKNRGIDFNITIEEAWEKYINQNKRCALTGNEIFMPDGNNNFDNLASLDRIDSNNSYTKENIQWILREINIMKSNLPEGTFIKLCQQVAENNK